MALDVPVNRYQCHLLIIIMWCRRDMYWNMWVILVCVTMSIIFIVGWFVNQFQKNYHLFPNKNKNYIVWIHPYIIILPSQSKMPSMFVVIQLQVHWVVPWKILALVFGNPNIIIIIQPTYLHPKNHPIVMDRQVC